MPIGLCAPLGPGARGPAPVGVIRRRRFPPATHSAEAALPTSIRHRPHLGTEKSTSAANQLLNLQPHPPTCYRKYITRPKFNEFADFRIASIAHLHRPSVAATPHHIRTNDAYFSPPRTPPQRCCQRPHLVLRFFSATHCRAEGSIPFYLPFSLAPASVKIKFIHSFILQSDAHRLSPRGRALDFPTAPVRRVRFLNQRRLDKPSLSAVGQRILPTLASGALRLISC